MSDWTEDEIRTDFAELGGLVYEHAIAEERAAAFDAWLAEDRRKHLAQGWTEGSETERAGMPASNLAAVRKRTNPYWLYA